MNVYKIRDCETPYSGGMALVTANNETEAMNVFLNNTKNRYVNEIFCVAILLENVTCDTEKPYIIAEEFYYE